MSTRIVTVVLGSLLVVIDLLLHVLYHIIRLGPVQGRVKFSVVNMVNYQEHAWSEGERGVEGEGVEEGERGTEEEMEEGGREYLKFRQEDSTTSTMALAASLSLNCGRNLALEKMEIKQEN